MPIVELSDKFCSPRIADPGRTGLAPVCFVSFLSLRPSVGSRVALLSLHIALVDRDIHERSALPDVSNK